MISPEVTALPPRCHAIGGVAGNRRQLTPKQIQKIPASMRIPASRLLEHLEPGCFFSLRASDYSGANNSLPYTEAVALVIRGEIEGVASPSGRIKYLRMLAESEREPIERPSPERECSSRSTVIANTRMGVYRQEVESSVMDEWGIPTRVVIGHIWQHYGARV